jgi:hypothetical protein
MIELKTSKNPTQNKYFCGGDLDTLENLELRFLKIFKNQNNFGVGIELFAKRTSPYGGDPQKTFEIESLELQKMHLHTHTFF